MFSRRICSVVALLGCIAACDRRQSAPELPIAIDLVQRFPYTRTSSKLPDCTQAMSDIAAASMTLRGLPATQTLAAIDLSGGTFMDINAGPGVNVIRVPSIRLRQPRTVEGYRNYNEIDIHLDPATDSVIINLDGSLDVGRYSNILVDGDGSKVIINMSGAEGAKASVGTESEVDPTILIPTGTITGFSHASLSNVFAQRVVLRGSGVTNELTCQ